MNQRQIAWMRARFWAYAPLLPKLFLEGRSVRARTPRLPEASGPREFRFGSDGAPFRLALIGESTAVGVGVERQEDGLGHALGAYLHEALCRPIELSIVGENGATLGGLAERCLGSVSADLDLALIVIGVNDTTSLTSGRSLRRTALHVIDALRERGIREIAFAGIPPIEQFTALPPTMRVVLGTRAHYLECVLMATLREAGGHYLRVPFGEIAEHLAVDGFHPSATGYRQWAALLAEALIERLPALRHSHRPFGSGS